MRIAKSLEFTNKTSVTLNIYDFKRQGYFPTRVKIADHEMALRRDAIIVSNSKPAVCRLLLSRIRPYIKQRDKIEETARVAEEERTYVKRSATEKARATAEGDRALADKAYRDAMGISAAEYVQLQTHRIQADACIKAAQCFIGIDKVATVKK